MPLIDLHAPPTESMRRWFGLSLAIVLALLALLFGRFGGAVSLGLWIASGLVALLYYAWPPSQLPIIRAWQLLTYPLAWIVGHFLYGLIFFGIVLPLGLVLRRCGYDPLRLRKVKRHSNWHDRPPPPPPDRYFKQF